MLENRLRDSEWLGCDEYTIADMAVYPWTRGYKDRGIDKAGFPNFMRWFEAMEARPAVQRNKAMAHEIRGRMAKAAEGKQSVNIYDTKDNAAPDRSNKSGQIGRGAPHGRPCVQATTPAAPAGVMCGDVQTVRAGTKSLEIR